MIETNKKDKNSDLETDEIGQKKSRKKKGMVKISPLTATLVTSLFMWNIGEFWKNSEENDVTKFRDWVLSNPKIDEQDFFVQLRQMVEISSFLMSIADVIEANLLQDEPESVIMGMYMFLRIFQEAKGELNNKDDVTKFNRKVFRILFNTYEKTPLFREKYRKIFRVKGNDNKHKNQWQLDTEKNVKARYSKMKKRLGKRQEIVSPKLYTQAMEIINRLFLVSQNIKIEPK